MKVWIVHYYDSYEINVCASAEVAIRKGRECLESLKEDFPEDMTSKWEQEFEEEVSQYGGEFSVEDVMWVTTESVWE